MRALRMSAWLVAACASCTTVLGINGDYTERSTQITGTSSGGGGIGEGGSSTSSSAEGAGGSGAQGGGGSGGTGGSTEQCSLPEDCTAPIQACEVHTCAFGTCEVAAASPNTPSNSQLYGDCRVTLCDGLGGITVSNDPNDIYDDGRECTTDYCDNGTSVSDLAVIGQICATGFCDDNGNCLGCIINTHCPAMHVCQSGMCVPQSCQDTVQGGLETDVDCGGPCVPCGNGLACSTGSDCQSSSCPAGTCALPTCMDGAKNGNETGTDCGGMNCPLCGANQECGAPSDCNSHVCVAGICQVATCMDGVDNGSETGVDCGGLCALCP